MARRGEGNFVAVEVGLRHDPKVLGLARRLAIHPQQAVGLVASWREFVLIRGTGAGVVHGYSRAELAAFLDWRRAPWILIDALRDAGQLVTRRRAFVHPFWTDTPTGYYASKKAKDRDRKKGGKGAPGGPEGGPGGAESGDHRNGTSAEVPRNGRGHSAEVPSGSGQEVSKDPSGGALPGGESEAGASAALADWFVRTYPKLRNPKKCRRLIAAMEADDRAQLAFCLPLHLPPYEEKKKKKAWRFVPFADSYLEDGTFWEHRPPKPKVEKQPDGEAEARALAEQLDASAKAEKSRQLLQQRAIIVEQLRSEGITVRRGEAAFEELVEQRMAAGDGRPS